jgi:cation diffusion facilitator family transporter
MLGNSAIAATKFIASAMTGSSAMLSEAIHSVVDTCNQLLLLWGLRQAKKPPDEEFPFGHGKEIYFWSFVVAIMIFALGAGISIYEGIKHLRDPHPVSNPMVNYIVLGLAMIFEGGAWFFAFKEFRAAKGKLGFIRAVREGKDPTLFVVLFEDSAAMFGLIIAFVGILLGQLTGIPYFDGAASVVIGLLLATVAGWLAHETKGLLIGEAAGSETRRELMAPVESDPTVTHVNELVTLQMGPRNVVVNMSLEFADELSLEELEASITRMNRRIRERFPSVGRVFIEAESWIAHREQVSEAAEPPGSAHLPSD